MGAAIARATVGRPPPAPSIFATVRDRVPDLQPQPMAKAGVLAISRAIEDEHCARAGTGLLLGSFQRVRHYRQSEARWRELARTVELAVALADFRAGRVRRRAPIEVPVARDHQLGREWVLIANSVSARACLAAWEVPASRPVPDHARRFEVVWSFDAAAVHAATVAAAGVLELLAPRVAARIPPASLEPPRPGAADLRFGSALAARAVTYVAVSRLAQASSTATTPAT
jgi:DICT domain-containing protein